jgi:hypothetical protein
MSRNRARQLEVLVAHEQARLAYLIREVEHPSRSPDVDHDRIAESRARLDDLVQALRDAAPGAPARRALSSGVTLAGDDDDDDDGGEFYDAEDGSKTSADASLEERYDQIMHEVDSIIQSAEGTMSTSAPATPQRIRQKISRGEISEVDDRYLAQTDAKREDALQWRLSDAINMAEFRNAEEARRIAEQPKIGYNGPPVVPVGRKYLDKRKLVLDAIATVRMADMWKNALDPMEEPEEYRDAVEQLQLAERFLQETTILDNYDDPPVAEQRVARQHKKRM